MSGMQTFANGIKHYIDTREVDESQLPEKTADYALDLLIETNTVAPMADVKGNIYTDVNGNILTI